MNDKILEILKENNSALTVSEIEEKLGFNTVEQLKELLKQLQELEDNYKIFFYLIIVFFVYNSYFL